MYHCIENNGISLSESKRLAHALNPPQNALADGFLSSLCAGPNILIDHNRPLLTKEIVF